MADAAAQADKIRLDEETLQAKMELEGTKLGMKAKQDEIRMNSDNEKEGVRIGADIAKNQAEQVIRAQQARNPKGSL